MADNIEYERFSILDLFREAEGDDTGSGNAAGGGNDAAQPQQGTNNDNAQANTDTGNDNGAADDFNMDMSLDNAGGGDEGTDDDNLETDAGGNDMGGGTDTSTAEPVEANTDIFYSLSAEEQKMKISELKNQYLQLFNASDELVEKINDIENDETTIIPLSRVCGTLITLKQYITDYLYNKFDSVSFYENDVKFNEFQAIFYSISNILKDVYRLNIQKE